LSHAGASASEPSKGDSDKRPISAPSGSGPLSPTAKDHEAAAALVKLSVADLKAAKGDEKHNPLVKQINDIQTLCKDLKYDLEKINANVSEDARVNSGPFINVFKQECERMNVLSAEMARSLRELMQGIDGELQMNERMEALQRSLELGRVPTTWAKLAYPSLRSLGSWIDNLGSRGKQLSDWTEDPKDVPLVTHINYLFNPQSFLTAIMQKHAQVSARFARNVPLDTLVIQTDITRKTPAEIESAPSRREGAYITGLWVDGAHWNWTSGTLDESKPREMFSPLPVVWAKAVPVDKLEKSGVFRCPVYRTQTRGTTYIFTANLRTRQHYYKWTLAGVCLLMEIDE